MWSDINNNGNSGSGSAEVKYVKFDIGKSVIRILDEEPYSRWTHWVQQANSGKGMSVDCIGKGCPVCKLMAEDKKSGAVKRFRASKSHAINVIIREQNGAVVNEVAILDKGNAIFGNIASIMEEMGDPRGYDLIITRKGKELGEISYTVMPKYPPTPLTSADLALSEGKYDIKELRKPLTAEQIETLLAGGSLQSDNATAESNTDTNLDVDFTRAV